QQDALAEATINREKIRLELQQVHTHSDSATLISAQIELENAQQHVVNSEYELQKSLDRDWEPEDLRRQYERALKAAQEGLAIAQARYNDALAGSGAGSLDRQILEQELALVDLRITQLQRDIDPLLKLDVERARLEVQKIENQIAAAQLIAPFDGEVLSLNIRAGSQAEAFQTAIVLAQPETLEITAELGSEQLNQMSLEQAATIALRNRPEETFRGTVHQLPYAFSGGTSAADDDDSRVRIRLDNPPTNLALGELAMVVITLEEKENVLWLPPTAIRTFQRRTFVVIEEADGQRRSDIRMGIESETRVEILEGVEEGQIIVGE
ncbi:MAG: HlyD family efflux transporter periplasmic adaptor subunit, partial [Chloroflexi bacterium]